MQTKQINKHQYHRIAIWGRIPPGYGGVTVHLFRLLSKLREAKLPFVFCDLDGKDDMGQSIIPFPMNRYFIWKLLRIRCKAMHFHTSKVPQLLFLLLLLKLRPKTKVILTLHSQMPMFTYRGASALVQFIFRSLFNRANEIIATNETIKKWAVEDLGINTDHVTVIPAFLPPSQKELQFDDFPDEINVFFNEHSPILGAQGFFGNFHNGKHVYQFEEIGRLLSKIREEYPNAGCYTAVSACFNYEHREAILALRTELNLEKHWILVETPLPAAPLYSRCDIFLRPTMTDGDSLSIRECLLLNIPVLASNAVTRPCGTAIYDLQEQPSMLLKQTLRILHNKSKTTNISNANQTAKKQASDNSKSIIEIYRKVLKHG